MLKKTLLLIYILQTILMADSGGVTKVFAHYENAKSSSFWAKGNRYYWGQDKNLVIDGFEYKGHRYNYISESANVKIRRSDNTNATGNPCGLFAEKNGDETHLKPTFPKDCDMAKVMAGRIINVGALDLFKNTGSSAKNIERVDFISPKGITAPSSFTDLDKAGHVVTEKSGNNAIKIAAILSLDANGNPSKYGPLVSIHSGGSNKDYNLVHIYLPSGQSIYGQSLGFYVNEQKPPQGKPWNLMHSNEAMGMCFVSLKDLGINPGQKYYGFSYFGRDVTNSMNLVDYNSFPKNTGGDTADPYGGVASYFADESLPRPFECTDQAFIGIDKYNNDKTYMSDISVVDEKVTVNAPFKKIQNTTDAIYSFGYNPKDNYIWGYNNATYKVEKVDANYKVVESYNISGLPQANYAGADVDKNGILYLYQSKHSNYLQRIDLNQKPPKRLTPIRLNKSFSTSDIAINPVDGLIYYIPHDTGEVWYVSISGTHGTLHKIENDFLTKYIKPAKRDGGIWANATFFDAEGSMYVNSYRKHPGFYLYKVDIRNKKVVGAKRLDDKIQDDLYQADGARCALASGKSTVDKATKDYGDAPDNGTKYNYSKYNPATWKNAERVTDGVYLGSSVTTEKSGHFSANADGDSDDAITDKSKLAIDLSSNTYSIDIHVSNKGSGTYNPSGGVSQDLNSWRYISAWIDWDNNGIYDNDEMIQGDYIGIKKQFDGTKTLTWDIPSGLKSGDKRYMRIRLTECAYGHKNDTETISYSNCSEAKNGSASFGEIEDYIVTAKDTDKAFTCSQAAYLFNGYPDTDAYTIDLSSGNYKLKKSAIPNRINATGYNIKDNLIWGYDINSYKVIKIDANYQVTSYKVSGLPDLKYYAGDVSKKGILYLKANNTNKIYMVDLNSGVPKYDRYIYMSKSNLNFGDFAFNPKNNHMYSISTTDSHLYKIDSSSGLVTDLGKQNIDQNEVKHFHTFVFDKDSNLYFYGSSGKIYKIDLSGKAPYSTVLFSTTNIKKEGGDGARCPNASVPQVSNANAMLLTRGDGNNNDTTNVYVFNIDTDTDKITNFHLLKKLTNHKFRSLAYHDGKFMTAEMNGDLYSIDIKTGNVKRESGSIDSNAIMALDFDEDNNIIYSIWSSSESQMRKLRKYDPNTKSSSVIATLPSGDNYIDEGLAYQGGGTTVVSVGSGAVRFINDGKIGQHISGQQWCVYGGEYVGNDKSYFINAESKDLSIYKLDGTSWGKIYNYGTSDKTDGLKGMAIAIVHKVEAKTDDVCYAIDPNSDYLYTAYVNPGASPLPQATRKALDFSGVPAQYRDSLDGQSQAYNSKDGLIYRFREEDMYFYSIDPQTAKVHFIKRFNGLKEWIVGASFYGGYLYIIAKHYDESTLYKIDTGNWDIVSQTDVKTQHGEFVDVDSLAINSSGDAYFTDFRESKTIKHLYSLDLKTGLAKELFDISNPIDLEGLSFAKDDNLYISNSETGTSKDDDIISMLDINNGLRTAAAQVPKSFDAQINGLSCNVVVKNAPTCEEGSNLIKNGGFPSGSSTSGWDGTFWTGTNPNYHTPDGMPYVYVDRDSSGKKGYQDVLIEEGKAYKLSFYGAYKDNYDDQQVSLIYLDVNKNPIGVSNHVAVTHNVLDDDKLVPYSLNIGQAPNNAKYLRVQFSTNNGKFLKVDGFDLRVNCNVKRGISITDSQLGEEEAASGKKMKFIIATNIPAPDGGMDIKYKVVSKTATAKSDFLANPRTTYIAHIEKGKQSVDVFIPIVDDKIKEDAEYFEIQLKPYKGAKMVKSNAKGIIYDNDDTPPGTAKNGVYLINDKGYTDGKLRTKIAGTSPVVVIKAKQGFEIVHKRVKTTTKNCVTSCICDPCGGPICTKNCGTSASYKDQNSSKMYVDKVVLYYQDGTTHEIVGSKSIKSGDSFEITLPTNKVTKDAYIKVFGHSDTEYSTGKSKKLTSISDHFAIRPDKFKISLGGKTLTNPLRAEESINMSVKAVDTKNKTSIGYTGKNFKESIIDSKYSGDQLSYGFNITGKSFVKGEILKSLSYKEVGILTIKIEEKAPFFAEIDKNDSPSTYKITPATYQVRIVPDHFDITYTLKDANPVDKITLFANTQTVMGSKLSYTVTAKNKLGDTTARYTSGKYSDDINVTVSHSITTDTARNLTLNYTNIKGSGSKTFLSSSGLDLGLVLKSSDFSSGVTQDTVYENFKRDNTKSENPLVLKITKISAKEQHGVGSIKVTGNKSNTAQKAYFYYGRAHAPSPQTSTTKSFDAKVYYEVYCKKCNKTIFTKAKGQASIDEVYWYILDSSTVTNLGSVCDYQNPRALNMSTATRKDKYDINVTAPAMPHRDKIFYTPKETFLRYHKFGTALPEHFFDVKFSSQNKKWAGKGDRGKTVDTNISQINNQSIDW